MAELLGCTDGGCIFGHPGGMHTNGGCKCLPSLATMRSLTLEEWSELRHKIRAQAAEVKRLRGLGVPATPPRYELRRNDDLALDEIVVWHPETVALEQLAEGLWQLRVFLANKQHVYVELHTRGRAHIKATVLENP